MSFNYEKFNTEYWNDRICYEDKYGKYISKLRELFENKFNLDVQIYINESHNKTPLFMSIQITNYQDWQDLSFIEEIFNQKISNKRCLSTYIDLTKYSLHEIYATIRLL